MLLTCSNPMLAVGKYFCGIQRLIAERSRDRDKRRTMKSLGTVSILFIAITIAATVGCSDTDKAPDVANDIRHALDQANLKDVSVSQDRDKGVVTLGGKVRTYDEKGRAESIAKSFAGTQVVSNEIGVRPNGDEGTAKKVDSDLDSGIDKNLDAMLVQHKLKDDVRYDVSNGVVTLKGTVPSRTGAPRSRNWRNRCRM